MPTAGLMRMRILVRMRIEVRARSAAWLERSRSGR
jgi:hypothetical protein